jgi:hypothetical protein
MLSLSSLEDSARVALQARVDHFADLVAWSTVVVAIGVALEGVELIHDAVAWTRRRRFKKQELADLREVAEVFPSGEVDDTESDCDHPRWVKIFGRVGLILVVIGVVGEWRCGAKLEDAQRALHAFDMAQLTAVALKADELLQKYEDAERELIALKARSLPRRLSSEQKDLLRRRLTSFTTRNIILSCVNGGAETFDFAHDFVDVIFRRPLAFGGQYPSSCASIVAPGFNPFPVQVEAGSDRQGDADILVKALVEIGVNKKDIRTRLNADKKLLAVTIGPKPTS